MKFTILIPHYKSGKPTAYCVSKLLEHKGTHEIKIIVIDNSVGDESINYLQPFKNEIEILSYQKEFIQSHGCAFDFAMAQVKTDYFITLESDSFPTQDNWLDYYEEMVNKGYDVAGSLLKLSGGEYIHPCGALYSKKLWQEAKIYCNEVEYAYFPNMSVYGGFDCHLMVHKSIVEKVMASPYDWIEPAESYKHIGRKEMVKRMLYYSPIVAPFHNGMGRKDETVKTYGSRTIESETPYTLLDNKKKLINRVGLEPGQWLTFFAQARGKIIGAVPTEIKWMKDRDDQQQEYTKMDNGLTHVWAGSSFLDMKGTDFNDVYEFKNNYINELYNSLPKNHKV